jgi:hypothetical protein
MENAEAKYPRKEELQDRLKDATIKTLKWLAVNAREAGLNIIWSHNYRPGATGGLTDTIAKTLESKQQQVNLQTTEVTGLAKEDASAELSPLQPLWDWLNTTWEETPKATKRLTDDFK